MQLRFSLRGVLVSTAILSIFLYGCVVRPTMLANRFAVAVNDQDMDAVDGFFADKNWRDVTYSSLARDPATRMDHIYADIFPRSWRDWFGCRRRIVVRIARHRDSNGQHTEWSEDIDLVSRATGITVWPPDNQF